MNYTGDFKMKAYSYKSYIITASNKEEAIRSIISKKLKLPNLDKPITKKFLFHRTPPSIREKISKQGLIPQVGDSYKWHWEESYKPNQLPKCVFLTQGWIYDTTYDDDIWAVDVSKLNSKYIFKDPDQYIGSNDKCVVYTKKIPVSALKLVYEGSGKADVYKAPIKNILSTYK